MRGRTGTRGLRFSRRTDLAVQVSLALTWRALVGRLGRLGRHSFIVSRTPGAVLRAARR